MISRGGSAGNRREFNEGSISWVECLLEYTCSGDGAFDFFGRETARNYPECGYRASSFLNVYPLKMFKKACRFLYPVKCLFPGFVTF